MAGSDCEAAAVIGAFKNLYTAELRFLLHHPGSQIPQRTHSAVLFSYRLGLVGKMHVDHHRLNRLVAGDRFETVQCPTFDQIVHAGEVAHRLDR